jgi:hypothetical protein
MKKAFYTGGNSTCRRHIRNHYELYKTRCKEKNILENHLAIPRTVLKQMVDVTKGPEVNTLDGMLEKAHPSVTFTRQGVLHAVAQFVACDDQV